MSTRANIIFSDSNGTKLYFYRHSDGYPTATGEDLKEFCKGYQKHLRNDAGQSAGWLILAGAYKQEDRGSGYEWKVGDYEPTDSIHGDVEYIYVIDLDAMVLETRIPTRPFYSKVSNCNLKYTKVIETYSISENPGIVGKRGAK